MAVADEAQAKLILEELQRPDAILRSDIKDLISEYLSSGQDLGGLMSILLERYHGYPHMIDIVGRLFTEFSLDPNEKITRAIQEKVMDALQVNRGLEKLDKLLEQPEPPFWLKSMLESDLWVDIIVRLPSQVKHRSPFLWFCLNRIAKEKPWKVAREVPPGCLQYDSYIAVLRSLVDDIGKGRRPISDFVRLITTDDLAICHAATVCHKMTRENKLKAVYDIDSMIRHRSRRASCIFRDMILTLDEIQPAVRRALVNDEKLTHELMREVAKKARDSPFVNYLISTKIKSDMFSNAPADDQVIRSAVEFLVNVSDEQISEEDQKFMVEAVKLIKSMRHLTQDKNNMAIVMRALRKRCFVDAWITKGLEELKKGCERGSFTLQMFRGVLYWHEHLRGPVAECIFESLRDTPNLEVLFDLLLYIMKLGYSVQILKKFSAFISANEQMIERKPADIRCFFSRLLDAISPPFTSEFVEALVECMHRTKSALISTSHRGVRELGESMRKISEFCTCVARHPTPLDLSQRTQGILRDLQDEAQS